MNIVIISGSHRTDSQSLKVSKWLAHCVVNKKAKADIIDLAQENIPLWSEAAWNSDSDLTKTLAPYLEKITQADAVILVAAEWAGMVPAALKNFLLYVGSKHAAHKPTMIVGVSAGQGGTYPIAELRMSGYKNNRLVYIPDHIIVKDVNNVMNDPDLDKGSEGDQYIKKRAGYSLDVLLAYAKALGAMRADNDLLHKDYPFGM